MKSIQRNSLWATAIVVAVGLLVFAGAYLYSRVRQDHQITAYLDRATSRLEQLARRDPHPNSDNVKAAKAEEHRLQSFVDELKPRFASSAPLQAINSRDFRAYLDTTIARLRTQARQSGVEVPTDYWFTFAAQKGAMNFSEKTLAPLAAQMGDIATLCQALFDAKVNALAWLKRSPVDNHDSLGSQDYLNAQPTTNRWAVVVPYEVAFQGFSSELAAVLDHLTRLPQCFIVTNLTVEPVSPGAAIAQIPRLLPPAQDGPSLPLDWARRYRLPEGAGRLQPNRVGPPGSTTVLAEQPLRFVLSVQAVRAL